jgi:hypothetical protein
MYDTVPTACPGLVMCSSTELARRITSSGKEYDGVDGLAWTPAGASSLPLIEAKTWISG